MNEQLSELNIRTIDILNSFTSGLTTYIQSESSSITCTESALHMLQVCEADLEYSCTKQGNSKHNSSGNIVTDADDPTFTCRQCSTIVEV